MNISVILAHPDQNSFNHAIASAVVGVLKLKNHIVNFHDLYIEGFNPILPYYEISKGVLLNDDIRSYCEEIKSADGIIIVHPNWWGQPPAILKGWIDRVFRPGEAYEFIEGDNGEGVPNGLLRVKSVVIFNTSNTPIDREKDVFADPLETIWKNCIFGLCSRSSFHRRMFNVIVTSSREERDLWLSDVRNIVDKTF